MARSSTEQHTAYSGTQRHPAHMGHTTHEIRQVTGRRISRGQIKFQSVHIFRLCSTASQPADQPTSQPADRIEFADVGRIKSVRGIATAIMSLSKPIQFM